MSTADQPGRPLFKDSRIPTLAVVGGYALSGFAMLTYFSYRGFMTRATSEKRLKMEFLGARRGLIKALAASVVYLAGFGALAWNLGLDEFVMQSMVKKDKHYMDGIRNDPYFRKIYLLDTMYYFGISQRLIDKTKQHIEAAQQSKPQFKGIKKENQLWEAATVLIDERKNVPTIHRRD